MATLYIYTALGPSRVLMFATIHANRELLEKADVFLAPIGPWNCQFIPTHGSPYMAVVPISADPPEQLASFLTEIERHLDDGQNILLFSGAVNSRAHQSLTRFLRHNKIPKKHAVKLLFSVGMPTLLYESISREYAVPFPDQAASRLSKMCCSLPELIESARTSWGKENVALLADLADSPTVICNDKLANQIFAWLGCPAPQYPEPLPRHPLFLASYTARRLNWALQVRDNRWPMLDETLYFETLRHVERNWGTEPFSPKKYRDELNTDGTAASRDLEKLLDLPDGTFACPDWLTTLPEIDFPPPLPKDKIREFVAALPESIRLPLHQRFINDAVILTPAQKALDTALIEAEPGFAHIGEPEQPVELTVLTMTYNQEKYIGECIESVLAQRTTFPVRHIVLDHHSTDDTPKIIASYAEQHKSIHPVLLNFRRPAANVRGLFARCRTRYAALCDGDDYFTDKFKLQKQVDHLEKHTDQSMCFHPALVTFEGVVRNPEVFPVPNFLPGGVREEYVLEDLLHRNIIQTNTAVYRWRFRDGLPKWFRADLCPGDWYWHLLHAEIGKVGFLREIMSVYRRHANGLYYQTTLSIRDHRRKWGLLELRAYKAYDEHFKGRYFRQFAELASDVFADFFTIFINSGDKKLLLQATTEFPDFARYFKRSMRVMQRSMATYEKRSTQRETNS